MPLFKIESPGKSKKLCVAETVAEVTNAAKLKLGLPADGSYKVYLQVDGTEIDEDYILVELANNSKDPLILCILEENLSWEESQKLIKSKEIQQQDEQKKETIEKPQASDRTIMSSSTYNIDNSIMDLNEILWSKVPERIKIECDKRENEQNVDNNLNSSDKALIVNTIREYMMDVLKDRTRSKAKQFATILCSLYPATFLNNIGGDKWDNGVDTLMVSIYNACLYRNSKNPQKKRKVNNFDENDSDDADVVRRENEIEISHVQDEYGCVDYAPKLPDVEDKNSQEEKRQRLLQLLIQYDENETEIKQLMDETYPTIRALINEADRDLHNLFEEWPLLKYPTILTQHSSRLLGKNIQQAWSTSLDTKSKYIRRYFKIANLKKPKGDKEKAKQFKQIIANSKEAAEVTRDKVPKILVVVPLLVEFFDEKLDNLYKVVDHTLSDSDIFELIDSNYPVLIIKGSSLYDGQATCIVVIQKNIPILCENATQGILLCFLCYYIFGFKYQPGVEKTLEFIQRVFLKINPQKGSKKDGKSSKKKTYDKAVFHLAKKLHEFSSEFNLE